MRTCYPLLIFFLLCIPFCGIADIVDSYKIKTDRSGNICILGLYNGYISIDTLHLGDSSSHESAYFIAKLTPSGSVIWAETIKGAQPGCGGICPGYLGLAVDNENNILVSLSSPDSILYKGVSYYQPNIIKLDSSGNCLWTKRIRQNDQAETDIVVDSKANIYYASTFSDSILSDTISLFSCDNTSQKTFVAKINSDGSTKWIKEIASPIVSSVIGLQECFFITVDSNGNSYVGGMANKKISLGSDVFECSGFYAFLANIDSNGNGGFLKGYYNRWILGSSHSRLADGCVSPKQRLYVCGGFRDTVDVSPSNYTVTKPNVITPYISKTNTSNGDAIWYQYNRDVVSPFYWNDVYSICSDNLDNTFVIGNIRDNIEYFNGSALSALTPDLSNTYFAKFDSAGNFQCYQKDTSRLISGTTFGSDYYTIGVGKDDLGHGFFRTYLSLIKWDIANCTQIWRTKFTQLAEYYNQSVNTAVSQNSFSLFPNPSTNGIFYKRSSGLKISSFVISNILGQEIPLSDHDDFIDISVQPKGLYIFRVIFTDSTILTGKISYQ